MKYILLIACFFIISTSAFSQRVQIDYGDIYFEFFQFKEAIKYYQQALNENPKPKQRQYIYEQLSQCYKYLFQYKKSEEYFTLMMTSGQDVKPEYYIDYGNVLKLNGKYEESKRMYKKFQEVTNTDLAEPFIRSVSWAIRNADTIKNYDIFPTNLDISGQALGYCFYDDGLIYSHARNKPKLGNSETPLFDLDYARKDGNNVDFKADLKIMDLITFDLNESAPCVSPDGTTLYFSANASKTKPGKKKTVGGIEVGEEGISNFKIYAAPSEGGMFQNPVALPFNDDDYSFIHPCISEDGKTLFFSSNMPGGFGGFDLWKSMRSDDGIWSDPVNMGRVVNSEENELFPWVSNGLFYFTSKGFNGYGGYDLFVAKLNKLMLPSQLKNLGQPINSYRDDVALITKDAGLTGYFSSNRDNEDGADFVYYFVETVPKEEYSELTTKKDTSKMSVSLPGALGGIASKVDMPGKVTGKEEPAPNAPTTVPSTQTGIPPVAPSTATDKPVVGSTQPTVSAPKSNTPPSGLSSPKKKVTEPNKVVAGQTGLKPKSLQPTVTNNPDLLDRKFTPVQFKFNDAGVNTSQMQAADSVAALLKANPGYKVYVAAHADSRGSFEYNLKLTDRRAGSVRRYLLSKGVPPHKIITKGLGESQLLNECADGISCSEEQHALNRRVEMRLVK